MCVAGPGLHLRLLENKLTSVAKDLRTVSSRTCLCEASTNLNNLVRFTPEEIEEFKKDHSKYQKFRKGKTWILHFVFTKLTYDFQDVELALQSIHGATLIGDPMQIEAHDIFVQNMKRRLRNKPELLDELVPSFPLHVAGLRQDLAISRP
ncbi:uncharacterized protein N7477_005940 [Penicillium maclennaniae]|uniref:uncharacterized protein n=1 Tax=Penicillium maclennaniae TaxID=1343394 RepID=UPI0025403484|nr:uncharacterized protein N7477_005940 [Penicillium maclennaniae]KAJ5670577.1 hypothetical protein N7477_005940 [Penicillium maclennaniae]